MKLTLKKVASKIKEASSRRPILIAVDGFGGSGKTTIADNLAKLLGDAFVIHLDDFIDKEKILEDSWDKGGFDRARLESQVLEPLSRGKAANYQKLIWQTNKLGGFIKIPGCKYLIVEGISSSHPEIADYYDYKIWVDTPLEIAKVRGRARDGSNENAKHWDSWAANDLKYQQKYHPEKKADFVVNNY